MKKINKTPFAFSLAEYDDVEMDIKKKYPKLTGDALDKKVIETLKNYHDTGLLDFHRNFKGKAN